MPDGKVLFFCTDLPLGFRRLWSKKKHIMLLAVLIVFRNYAKIMLLSENYALCRFYTDFKENKDHQYLNSINFDFNEHSYSPPSNLTVFSIANTHVRNWKSQMINKWYQNQPFLGSESGSESYSPHTCLKLLVRHWKWWKWMYSRTTPSLIWGLRGRAAEP